MTGSNIKLDYKKCDFNLDTIWEFLVNLSELKL
jgi:hypothetical protein